MQNEIGKRRLAHDYMQFFAHLLAFATWDGRLAGGDEPWTWTSEGVAGVSLAMISKAVNMPLDYVETLANEHGITIYQGVPSEKWRRDTGAPLGTLLPSVAAEEAPFLLAYMPTGGTPNDPFKAVRHQLRELAWEFIIKSSQVPPFNETAWRHIQFEESQRKAGELA